MLDGTTPLLRNFWYLALAGRDLKAGRMTGLRLLGESLLLGRTKDGGVFALRDICPHRGIPLRHGSFDGREVACCYHGWRFAPDGRCTAIPSLVEGQDFDVSQVRVPAYPCREVQGNIWVFMPEAENGEAPSNTASGGANGALPEVPQVPGPADAVPQVTLSRLFPCHADHAAFGLMDPTHAAFVHTSWWWKRKAGQLRNKEKHFEPAPLGWRMARHRLPPENRAYKLLGDHVTTEITYSLPGIRVEAIEGERHSAVALTAITPIDEDSTQVHQSLYCTADWVKPFRPLGKLLAGIFLDQDLDMVIKQKEGLEQKPKLMLVDDADTQAKWFHRVKIEWLRAAEQGRPFETPIKGRTLRWRS